MSKNISFSKVASRWSESKKMKESCKEFSTGPDTIIEILIKISYMLKAMLTGVSKSKGTKLKECYQFTKSFINWPRVMYN